MTEVEAKTILERYGFELIFRTAEGITCPKTDWRSRESPRPGLPRPLPMPGDSRGCICVDWAERARCGTDAVEAAKRR